MEGKNSFGAVSTFWLLDFHGEVKRKSPETLWSIFLRRSAKKTVEFFLNSFLGGGHLGLGVRESSSGQDGWAYSEYHRLPATGPDFLDWVSSSTLLA